MEYQKSREHLTEFILGEMKVNSGVPQIVIQGLMQGTRNHPRQWKQ